MSNLERAFETYCNMWGLPPYHREYRFHDTRRWRFDFAWPERNVAVEIEGGVWTRGRHTRGKGFENDCEKYNAAVLLGWRVLRFTGAMLDDPATCMNQVAEILGEADDAD